MLTNDQADILAAVCGEFLGNGNALQIEKYVTDSGWTIKQFDGALKALGSQAGTDLGWLE